MKVALFNYWSILTIWAGLNNRSVSPHQVAITNFGCKYNEALVTDVICRYKPARGKLGIFSFGGTPVVPLPSIWVKFDTFKKNSANKWQLGKIHIVQDLCEFYKAKNNLFLFFFAQFKESVFDKVVRECPYTERVELLNYTLERKDVDAVLNVFPVIATGDFLVNLTMSLDRNGRKFFAQLFTVWYVKGNALKTGW